MVLKISITLFLLLLTISAVEAQITILYDLQIINYNWRVNNSIYKNLEIEVFFKNTGQDTLKNFYIFVLVYRPCENSDSLECCNYKRMPVARLEPGYTHSKIFHFYNYNKKSMKLGSCLAGDFSKIIANKKVHFIKKDEVSMLW